MRSAWNRTFVTRPFGHISLSTTLRVFVIEKLYHMIEKNAIIAFCDQGLAERRFFLYDTRMAYRWVIGVDEVGRGALAGPLVVAAVAAPAHSKWLIANSKLPDSKQLTSSRREDAVKIFRIQPELHCAIVAVSHRAIDRFGMTNAGKMAVRRVLQKMSHSLSAIRHSPLLLLDGGLSAPQEYRQLTVIRGDEQLPIIAAASIIAKVHRDRHMRRQHRRFPQYGFDAHVGYGTRTHYRALRRFGPSPIHRLSFRCVDVDQTLW